MRPSRVCSYLLLLLFFLASCTSVKTVITGQALVAKDRRYPSSTPKPKAGPPPKTYETYWLVDPKRPVTRLEVWLKEQVLIVFQGDLAAAVLDVSSGKRDHETPIGRFEVQEKDAHHFSSRYGEIANAAGKVINYNAEPTTPVPKGCHYQPSAMPFFLRLTDQGVGLHAGYLPGYAASHGCIRLKTEAAEKLFQVVPPGTKVEVIP